MNEIEFYLFERRGYFVLHHPNFCPGADHILALLDGSDSPDIESHGGVKFERIASGGRLRISKHDADFHSNLVDENHDRMGLADGGGQFSQGLRHQPCLKSHMGLAHLPLNLCFGNESSHRVDDDHIHSTTPNQNLCNL